MTKSGSVVRRNKWNNPTPRAPAPPQDWTPADLERIKAHGLGSRPVAGREVKVSSGIRRVSAPKAKPVVARGSGGRLAGSVAIGSSRGKVTVRGSGLGFGQLRQMYGNAVAASNPLGVPRSMLQAPGKAGGVAARIRQDPNGTIIKVQRAVGHRAYQRVYKSTK